MAQNKSVSMFRNSAYPIPVSLAMIVIAIVLSFVDLAFLNDVIGKVLDLGSTESMAIAFALGLVGIAIMMHKGVKEAHGMEGLSSSLSHYLLWIFLGIAFVLIRLFSATIMQLDESSGDQSLMNIMGITIRQVDLVVTPLMLFLYFATGLLAKDGVKNLLLNPDYDKWWTSWREARKNKKTKEEKMRESAEKRMAKLQEEAEQKRRQREKEMEDDRIKNALTGSYSNALVQYRAKEKEIQEKYQIISSNLDYVIGIDKQEQEFEYKVKPSLLSIVEHSIQSVQNNVALAMRKKTGGDITKLRDEIQNYNQYRHDKNK